jgi:hypothetical protein
VFRCCRGGVGMRLGFRRVGGFGLWFVGGRCVV